MCTYATLNTDLEGSAKGPESKWFHVSHGTVYFDHPVHAMADHTLNIDFTDPIARPVRARRGRADRQLRAGAGRGDRGGAGVGAGGDDGLRTVISVAVVAIRRVRLS